MCSFEEKEKFIRSLLTEEEITKIVAEARQASDFAWATYSKFNVGVCLLTFEGDYIFGCNIENISYSQTVHGEGCAISKAISAKKCNFKALAVYAKSENFDCFIPPCGECRQFLSEFVNFLPIILVHETGVLKYELLHELLPLSFVLGSTAPKSEKKTGSKYDQLVFKANGWILRDIFAETRHEMKKLLADLCFDEIHELTKEKLQFKEPGVLSGRFRAGPASVNFLTIQEFFEGFANVEKGSKDKVAVTYHGNDRAKSIAHRIVATLNGHNRSTTVAAKESNEGVEGSFKVHVSSKEDGGNQVYEVRITDGQNQVISKEFTEKIYAEREKLLTSAMLNKWYDYNQNRLLTENDFVSA